MLYVNWLPDHFGDDTLSPHHIAAKYLSLVQNETQPIFKPFIAASISNARKSEIALWASSLEYDSHGLIIFLPIRGSAPSFLSYRQDKVQINIRDVLLKPICSQLAIIPSALFLNLPPFFDKK